MGRAGSRGASACPSHPLPPQQSILGPGGENKPQRCCWPRGLGMGICSGGEGDHCLKKTTIFLGKKEGERVEKLLPVEFTAWLEVVGGCGGLGPAQLRAVALPQLPVGNGRKHISGCEKFPWHWRRNSWKEKSIRTPSSRGAGWDPGRIQGSWRNHIPHEGARGGCRELLLFPFRFLPRLFLPS